MLIEFVIKPSREDRIHDVQTDWHGCIQQEVRIVGGATLLVVHTNHEYDDIDRWLKTGESGGGVLFITGGPEGEHASLQEQLSKESHNVGQWPRRWYVLKTPISGKQTSPELRGRFARFLKDCAGLAPGENIPWEKLYSITLSENVLSIYLWCLAQPTLVEKRVSAPEELWRISDAAWRDLCTLDNERRIPIPDRLMFNKCLTLDSDACREFARWVKEVLVPTLS